MTTKKQSDSASSTRIRRPATNIADTFERADVPAVAKAFDILELLASAPQGLTMNEMVAALKRTMGEIYRIAVYMTKRGYIVQDPESSRYSLTLRLFELAHQNMPTNRLVRSALPLMEQLAQQCEQSCHLGVLYETSILVLASAPSPRPACYSVKAGAVFPLRDTSSGMVILAYMKPEARERLLLNLDEADRESAASRSATIAHKGYERKNSVMVHGILNLCVPVFDHTGVVGALTMAYIDQVNQKVTANQSLTAVRNCAQQLSTVLGYLP